MARRTRLQYALVLTQEPAAADIFRQDEIREVEAVFTVGTRVTVKRPSWQSPCEGLILRVATKCDLSRVRVSAEGALVEAEELKAGAPYLPTRCKALANVKGRSKALRLQQVASALAAGGPDILPVPIPSAVRLPRRRLPEDVEAVKHLMANLACFRQGTEPGMAQLCDNSNIWLPAHKLWGILRTTKNFPAKMFIHLLDAIIGVDLLSNEAVSRTGSRDTVAVPLDVLEKIDAFVQTNSRGLPYNRNTVLSNRLYYLQHKADILNRRNRVSLSFDVSLISVHPPPPTSSIPPSSPHPTSSTPSSPRPPTSLHSPTSSPTSLPSSTPPPPNSLHLSTSTSLSSPPRSPPLTPSLESSTSSLTSSHCTEDASPNLHISFRNDGLISLPSYVNL